MNIRHIKDHPKPKRPIRILQFGTGGFLRGFADWMIQKINDTTDFNGNVVVVQSTDSNTCEKLAAQNCLYTHVVQNADSVQSDIIDVIDSCIKLQDNFDGYLELAMIPTLRFVISNTTEAGIIYDPTDLLANELPKTFPARLTLLLKRRFEAGLPGFVFLPCELIDENAQVLKNCILQYAKLWNLDEAFSNWIKNENTFCNTLVDRINTGFPKDIALSWQDDMANASESYHLWVIETDMDLEAELPFSKAGLNVIITRDGLEKYHLRKVRILNGAHAALVCRGILSGLETVGDCMKDTEMATYLNDCIFKEIIPTLDMPQQELVQYAQDILERFKNPYIHHKLSAISLNSVSKFKVRILPTIMEYKRKFGTYPANLCYAFSKLLEFYKTDLPKDDPQIIAYLQTHSTAQILANKGLWGYDLSELAEVLENANPQIG